MNEQRFESAEVLFQHSLRTWGERESFMMRDEATLPDCEVTWWQLHPREVEMFGIDPQHFPRLLEAYSWYAGAIAGSAHNDYHDFLDVERARWRQHVVTKDGEAVFDRDACMRFMHEAAALPLRQCEAFLQKLAAAELRGPLLRFRDEPPFDDEKGNTNES